MGTENLVLELIYALQALPAVRILPSRNGPGVLFDDIVHFTAKVISGKFSTLRTIILFERAISREPSIDIWDAVHDLVAVPETITLPTAPNKAVLDTSLKSNWNSQQTNKQDPTYIDECILRELDGRIYDLIKGFHEKYFEERSWWSDAERIIVDVEPQTARGRWDDFPNPPSRSDFLQWFLKLQSTYFPGERGTYFQSSIYL
ncbi:MAG: hypothetical protein M1813_001255 [Trichoglossum hirsutum]|nr:MAG: hypothetical protein M1813_001255 [Trichoglossum hirsutum]